jgi:hypothetical protein
MRLMLVAMILVASCGGEGAADVDLAVVCPEPADLAPPPDLELPVDATPPADMAACYALACPRLSTCGGYVNQGTETDYLTCCAPGLVLHCHDSLGIGETCERSVCAPGATCANGFPNGGTMPLAVVCCTSPAAAPAMKCATGP